MNKGNLFVISGPSGAGKGTILSQVMSRLPDVWLSVSATTRTPRKGEVDGVDYFFLTHERFEDMIKHDGLLEWARYAHNYYGTPREHVVEHLRTGTDVFLEIEVQGALQVRERYPEANLIFIEPPTLETLLERLRGRGTEDESTIQKRFTTAKLELEQKMEYDIQIVNDNLDEAIQELYDYVINIRDGKGTK